MPTPVNALGSPGASAQRGARTRPTGGRQGPSAVVAAAPDGLPARARLGPSPFPRVAGRLAGGRHCSWRHGQSGRGQSRPASPGVASPGPASPGVASPGPASPGVASPGVASPGVAARGAVTRGAAGPGQRDPTVRTNSAVAGPRPLPVARPSIRGTAVNRCSPWRDRPRPGRFSGIAAASRALICESCGSSSRSSNQDPIRSLTGAGTSVQRRGGQHDVHAVAQDPWPLPRSAATASVPGRPAARPNSNT